MFKKKKNAECEKTAGVNFSYSKEPMEKLLDEEKNYAKNGIRLACTMTYVLLLMMDGAKDRMKMVTMHLVA